MAGDWIKWTKGLSARREVAVLASRLGRDRHEIAARLMVLWEWCDDNVSAGDVDSATLDVSLNLGDSPFAFVDALLGLPGMAEVMASPEVRWIEARSGGRLTFPRLARHNGTSAKTRAYEQRKKQNQRHGGRSPSPVVSPKGGDNSGTREEKRREKSKDPPNPPLGGGREGEVGPEPRPPKARHRPAPTESPAFVRFYDAYPKKAKRPDAAKAFARLDPDADLLAAMLAKLALFKACPKWAEDGGRYVPHPATWLNGRCWEDDVPVGGGPAAGRSERTTREMVDVLFNSLPEEPDDAPQVRL